MNAQDSLFIETKNVNQRVKTTTVKIYYKHIDDAAKESLAKKYLQMISNIT